MANLKEKLSQMINKKKLAEGLSPIYEKGKITPGTRGLGPEYEKDIKLKMMEKRITPIKKKPKEQPKFRGVKFLA